jgi:hypothetical protein
MDAGRATSPLLVFRSFITACLHRDNGLLAAFLEEDSAGAIHTDLFPRTLLCRTSERFYILTAAIRAAERL